MPVFFENRKYKEAIKEKIKEARLTQPALTLKKIAEQVSIQYTYLSKVLNSAKSHLSDDQCFAIGRALHLMPDEIQFLLLLKSLETTQYPERKNWLVAEIDRIAKAKTLKVDKVEVTNGLSTQELRYLLTPIVVIVHVSLFIKDFQKNPRALCSLLGLPVDQLKEILATLQIAGYIVLAPSDCFVVEKVLNKRPFFTREHPLMRAHQSLLKNLLQARLEQTREDQKEAQMVTFTMDVNGFEKVKTLFAEFLQKVQQHTLTSKHTALYQINFDFLRWF